MCNSLTLVRAAMGTKIADLAGVRCWRSGKKTFGECSGNGRVHFARSLASQVIQLHVPPGELPARRTVVCVAAGGATVRK